MAFLDEINRNFKLQCYHNINGKKVATLAEFAYKTRKNPVAWLKQQAWKRQAEFNSALIYEKGNDTPLFKLLDGIIVNNTRKEDDEFYDELISKFKLKIITRDGFKHKPIYSNILHDDIFVFIHYINRYIRTIFKDNLANALIYDNQEDKAIAQIKRSKMDENQFVYRSRKFKEYTPIDQIFQTLEQFFNMRKLQNQKPL